DSQSRWLCQPLISDGLWGRVENLLAEQAAPEAHDLLRLVELRQQCSPGPSPGPGKTKRGHLSERRVGAANLEWRGTLRLQHRRGRACDAVAGVLGGQG